MLDAVGTGDKFGGAGPSGYRSTETIIVVFPDTLRA